MAVYIIASFDVIDKEAYKPYVPGLMPILNKYGIETLVADFNTSPLEGQSRGVYVVMKCDSEETVRRWHDDPDYQPLKKLRERTTTNATMVIADELRMP